MTADLSYDYEREKKGEVNKWDGKNKEKNAGQEIPLEICGEMIVQERLYHCSFGTRPFSNMKSTNLRRLG